MDKTIKNRFSLSLLVPAVLAGTFYPALGADSRLVAAESTSEPHSRVEYPARNLTTAHRIDVPPKIDGVLNEDFWQVGTVMTHFSVAGQPADILGAKSQTEVRAAYDTDNLYVAAKLYTAAPDSLVAKTVAANSDGIYEDDILELFLDPQRTQQPAFHIAVNSRGTLWAKGAGTGPVSGVVAAASVGDSHWNVELQIPLRSLGSVPTRGTLWSMNVAREQKHPVLNSTWAPLDTPAFQDWPKFGVLSFGDAAKLGVQLATPLSIANNEPVSVSVKGGAQESEITVEYDRAPAPAGQGLIARDTRVNPRQKSSISFEDASGQPGDIDPTVKAHKIVRVIDKASGTLLSQTVIERSLFEAGAVMRDGPSSVREVYRSVHPELCTTDTRPIYNGRLYVSPDHVTPRSISFFHNATTGPTILNGPPYDLRLVFEMPKGVEVTAVASLTDTLLSPGTFPDVTDITLNGKPAKRFVFRPSYIQNPLGDGSHMAYFKSSLPAGTLARGSFYLEWEGGRQPAQELLMESISIPKVRAPRRFFIMPWGLELCHVQLLSPDFPEDYTSLGMNIVDYTYLGNLGPESKDRVEKYIQLSESIRAKANKGGVHQFYNGFFPYAPGVSYGMRTWMSDPDAWAYGADGKPTSGWLDGHTPCPSYRGKFYQDAVHHFENSEQLRRAPANFFSMDTEYYNGRGVQLCFCPRCVGLFETWFKKRYPNEPYIDPFTIEKNTQRPDTLVDNYKGNYEVQTQYPLHYRAWVEFKIEQFNDLIGGFKKAIAKVVGTTRTTPFKNITFSDWAGVYPTLLQREQALFGTSSLDTIEMCAVGAYAPPAFAFHPDYSAKYSPVYFNEYGKRRSIYDTPATSGAWTAAGYAAMPEHSRYYLLESAMNGPQGFLLFHYSGLEGKQLQLNAQVFGAFALVDDLITEGEIMKNLRVTGREMHARGLKIGRERLILVGDNYVATDKRTAVLTCPVEERLPVYDLLLQKKIGELTPQKNTITLTIDGLNDRARFLYIGGNWENRRKGNF